MQILTSIERLVIESITNEPKGLGALNIDTGLELKLLINIVNALTLRGYIRKSAEGYELNPHLPEREIEAINSVESRRFEALEIIEGLSSASQKKIGLKKAWVSTKDRAILQAMIKNIETFVATLPPAPKNAALCDYTVVVWGEDQYGAVINRLIEEAL